MPENISTDTRKKKETEFMKRLAWLLAGCLSLQPTILFAAKPKVEDPLKATKEELKTANEEAFNFSLAGDSEKAFTTADEALKKLTEEQVKALLSNPDVRACWRSTTLIDRVDSSLTKSHRSSGVMFT